MFRYLINLWGWDQSHRHKIHLESAASPQIWKSSLEKRTESKLPIKHMHNRNLSKDLKCRYQRGFSRGPKMWGRIWVFTKLNTQGMSISIPGSPKKTAEVLTLSNLPHYLHHTCDNVTSRSNLNMSLESLRNSWEETGNWTLSHVKTFCLTRFYLNSLFSP